MRKNIIHPVLFFLNFYYCQGLPCHGPIKGQWESSASISKFICAESHQLAFNSEALVNIAVLATNIVWSKTFW